MEGGVSALDRPPRGDSEGVSKVEIGLHAISVRLRTAWPRSHLCRKLPQSPRRPGRAPSTVAWRTPNDLAIILARLPACAGLPAADARRAWACARALCPWV